MAENEFDFDKMLVPTDDDKEALATADYGYTGNLWVPKKVSEDGSIDVNNFDNLVQLTEEQKKLLETISTGAKDENSVFGLEWNQTNDSYSRLEGASGLSQSDFDDIYPWSAMRRCNVADDGTVNSYYGGANYTEDGSNGQVMVEIPKFYYKVEQVFENGEKKYRWYISSKPFEGFKIHPAFVRNGEEKQAVYFSAYEGYYNSTTEKMESIADVQPSADGGGESNYPDGSIVGCRGYAQARGEGWEMIDFLSVSAIQLLYLIEYADFNMQSTISEGVTNLDSGNDNHAQNTGHTSELGNSSGEVIIDELENGATGATETYAMSYRGIENFFGNIWTWIDGINVNDHSVYVADTDFESDKFSGNYEYAGIELIDSGDYVSDIGLSANMDFGFLPTEVNSNSSSHLTSYFWENDGERVAALGGFWSAGSPAGAFCWRVDLSSSRADRRRGARLMYTNG